MRRRSFVAIGLSLFAVFVSLVNPSPVKAQASGLVAGYAFSEASGTTTADASGNNNTGTVNGTIWTTAGQFGSALVFNGTSAFVDLGNPATLQLTGSLTLSAWIKTAAFPVDDAAIVSRRDVAVGFQLDTTVDTGPRTIGFKLTSATGDLMARYGASAMQVNQWYFVTGVYDAAARTLNVYLNGVLDNGALVGTVSATQQNSAVNVNIGRRTGLAGFAFNGTIDEVRIYNRALSLAEIQADMAAPVGGTPPPPDTTPPTAPTVLSAAVGSTSQIDLSWTASTDNVGVTGYQIDRCQGAGCATFAQIGTSAVTSFSDTGLAASTTYRYRVRATDAAGNVSANSSIVTATTQAVPDTTPPSVPASLSATAASSAQINLAWSASTDNVGVTGYRVERCQGAGCTVFAQIATPTTTSLNDTGLTAGASYSYQVRAADAAGNLSAYSNVASATTSSTPSGLMAAYSFNEGAGTTVTDASGNNNTGTVNGTTWTTAGQFGSALVFNGTSAFVDLGNPATLQLTGSLTLSAWIKTAAFPVDDAAIVSRRDVAVGFQLDTTVDTGPRTIGFKLTSATGDLMARYGASAMQVNQWYFVTGVYDAAARTLNVYLNGVLDNGALVGTVSATQQNSAVNVNIGRRTGLAGFAFNGTIDEVRIYNRALSLAEIQADMAAPVGGTPPPPDTTPPSAPASLVATAASATQINLTWSASTDNVGVTGYRLERCQGAGCSSFAQIAAPATTSFNDTGLSASTSYNYRVRAADAAGNLSAYSNIAPATTPTAPDTTPPTAPTVLSAAVGSTSQIDLSWTASTDNVGVTGYQIDRCQGAGCATFAQIGTSAVTSFSDTGLAASTTYRYRVRATDAAGNVSANSSIVTAITQAVPDTTPPSVPASLSATAASSAQINLAWSASTDNVGVTGYRVERCQGAGCTVFAQIATPATTSFNDTGLTAGASYSYQVRAADAAGNLSAYSNVASATTSSTPSGLMAAYSFNEGAGTTVTDASGNNNTGTVNGTTWTTAGQFGSALVFNGTSAFVDLGNPATLQLTGSLTLSAWIKTAAFPVDDAAIVSRRDVAVGFQLDTTVDTGPRTIGFKLTSATGDLMARYGASAMQVNQWYHVTGVYDAAARTLNVYLNGVLDNGALVGTVSATQQNSAVNVNIGRRTGLAGFAFNGTIDEVRIYNRALSLAEIQADMAAPVGGTPPPPDTTPPSAPASLVATAASATQINLTWSASTDNVGVTGYRLERCQGAGCSSFAQIAAPATTSFNDTGLSASTSYNYRVRAADAAGNLSAYSNIAPATTPTAPDTTPPTAPTVLSAAVGSTSQIDLSWTASTDNVGVTGYQIDRCQGAGCATFAQIGTSAVTSFSDTGLAASTTYRYRVRATDAAGNVSANSSIVTAITQAVPDTTPPSVPASLSATAASSAQINLAWSASTDNVGVTGYRVERCQGAGCTVFAQIATPATTSFNDTGLTAGASYSYQVRAADAAGNLSAYSNVASATTSSTPSGLMAAYSFNEGAGTTVTDASGNNNTGTVNGTTWTTAGQFGSALVFNGTSAFVDLGNPATLQLTGSLTLSAWIKTAAFPVDDAAIVSRRDVAVGFQLDTTVDTGPRTIGFKLTSATGDLMARYGASAMQVNQWYHVTGVYDAAARTLNVYLNGVLDNGALVGTVSATQQNSAVNVNIGRRTGLAGFAFNGTIDEVRIYNRALSLAEIQADMATSIGNAGSFPAATLSSSSISFPDQGTGTTSSAQAVTMSNTGGATLLISGIAISGSHSFDYSQVNDCGSSLAPSGSCTINVVFTPSATGTRTATVVISDNAPGSPHTIALTGTGVASTGLSVSPRAVALTFARTQQFTTNSGGVTWLVDGIPGGSGALGTVTPAGLYTPPSTAGVHTVTASASGQSANATVYVTNNPGVFTHHNDNFRTGQNLSETVLTPANVTAAKFGKLFSYPLDGIAYASPLYVANVNIPGQGFHNVVYVATEHDSVYAFDADGLSSNPLWHVSFIDPAAGVTPVPSGDTAECCDIAPEIGITGTPVIDSATGTLYVVAKTKEVAGATTNYVQRLHALDIATGAEKFGGPVVIQANVPGNGLGAVGGRISFDPLGTNQRPALLLSNGVVYIGFGSHGNPNVYHGWVLGYDPATLQQVMAFNTTPDARAGGVWQAGGGPAVDADGNMYFATGNGTFDASAGGADYGDSVVKLSPAGVVLDYFSPHDQETLDAQDIDLGSAGVLLLPDQNGPNPRLLIAAGKAGTIFLCSRDDLGHFNLNGDTQIVQVLPNALPGGTVETGNRMNPVYYNGRVYFSAVADNIKAFQLNNGLLSLAPTSQSVDVYNYPGGPLAISANGSAGAILWTVQRFGLDPSGGGTVAPGVLHAYDPANLGNEFYNSNQAGARDTLDFAAKFSVPLVVNGKVFVSSESQVTVYGLLP